VLLSLDSGLLAGDYDSGAPLIVGKHEGIEALLGAIRAAPTRTPHAD
jgi:hypothetical protein